MLTSTMISEICNAITLANTTIKVAKGVDGTNWLYGNIAYL